METAKKTYAEALLPCSTVDTTEQGGNGYPRGLQVAYTAETMLDLRELRDAAKAVGHTVDVVRLHRRDGWRLWERTGWCDLDDDLYQTADRDDHRVIDLKPGSSREAEAFEAVCGKGYELESAKDLIEKAKEVQELANELPDPDELYDDESVRVFFDNYNAIKYTVRSGQNGYNYDTHQYRTALIIRERDEEGE